MRRRHARSESQKWQIDNERPSLSEKRRYASTKRRAAGYSDSPTEEPIREALWAQAPTVELGAAREVGAVGQTIAPGPTALRNHQLEDPLRKTRGSCMILTIRAGLAQLRREGRYSHARMHSSSVSREGPTVLVVGGLRNEAAT